MASWDNVVSGSIGAVVGGIGGFLSRKSSKEQIDLDRLEAALESWEAYAQKMQTHWESCEARQEVLEEKIHLISRKLWEVEDNCAKHHRSN